MKKITRFIVVLLACTLFSLSSFAQDVIVLKDGKTILSKINQISKSEIQYKKFSNLDGPLYIISTSEVLSINFENGEQENFQALEQTNTAKLAATNDLSIENQQFIQTLNTAPKYPEEYKKLYGKKCYGILAFAGVESSSLILTDELNMSFNTHDDLNYADLLLTNTSSDIIYIDLARSFTIDQDNNCTPLYSGKTYSSTKGNDLGAGLGLGAVAAVLGIDGKVGTLLNGLSLSKNTSNYDTTTIVEQQIIAIPPHSSKVILNVRVPIFNVNPKSVKLGDSIQYSYDESPIKWTYFITYSKDKQFETFSNLYAKMFCNYLYGIVGGWNIMPVICSSKSLYTPFKPKMNDAKYYRNSYDLGKQVRRL